MIFKNLSKWYCFCFYAMKNFECSFNFAIQMCEYIFSAPPYWGYYLDLLQWKMYDQICAFISNKARDIYDISGSSSVGSFGGSLHEDLLRTRMKTGHTRENRVRPSNGRHGTVAAAATSVINGYTETRGGGKERLEEEAEEERCRDKPNCIVQRWWWYFAHAVCCFIGEVDQLAGCSTWKYG